jgi:hypothetical protein
MSEYEKRKKGRRRGKKSKGEGAKDMGRRGRG